MTQATQTPDQLQQRRDEWISRIEAMAEMIGGWAKAEGWQIRFDRKTLDEELLGSYIVPTLIITMPGGELSMNPIALHVAGGNGRIDLEAFPTLSRVKLIGIASGWQIMTDSNVPLRAPWNRETFAQLARDLLA